MKVSKKIKSQKVLAKTGEKPLKLLKLPDPDPELFSRPRMDGGKEGLVDKILDWLVGAGEPRER